MEEIKKIVGSNSARFVNAQHAYFHSSVCEMVNSVGFSNLNIPLDLEEEYKKCIGMEEDLNNESRAYIETPQLNSADAERDAITVYLFSVIRSAALAPQSDIQKAGEVLSLIIKPYLGLQSEARDQQTSKTIGLILDLRKKDIANYITVLGQTQTVALLEESNNKYRQLERSLTELKASEILENSKVVRPRTDALYQRITEFVNASYLLGDEAKKALIAPLINNLNQFIAEQKTAYKQSQAQKGKTNTPPTANTNPEEEPRA